MVGYTLWYYNEEDTLTPMNLTHTIPEQLNSYDSYFVLKRRYYTICPLEARSLSLTEKLYTKFKEVVMSGDLKITETK